MRPGTYSSVLAPNNFLLQMQLRDNLYHIPWSAFSQNPVEYAADVDVTAELLEQSSPVSSRVFFTPQADKTDENLTCQECSTQRLEPIKEKDLTLTREDKGTASHTPTRVKINPVSVYLTPRRSTTSSDRDDSFESDISSSTSDTRAGGAYEHLDPTQPLFLTPELKSDRKQKPSTRKTRDLHRMIHA
jgi:hypothetical protein